MPASGARALAEAQLGGDPARLDSERLRFVRVAKVRKAEVYQRDVGSPEPWSSIAAETPIPLDGRAARERLEELLVNGQLR